LDVYLRFAPTLEHKVGAVGLAGRDFVFQYAESFLPLGLPLSPLRLPLQPGLHVYDGNGRMETFGVFDDAMPDSWGRRLIDKHFHKRIGRRPGVLERLAFVGERAMGALVFRPPEEIENSPVPDLGAMAVEAWDFDSEMTEEDLPELRKMAGTSGGARPKILVGIPEAKKARGAILSGDNELPPGYSHWIVKFNSREEGADAGPLEFAYAELAATAGAEMPEHRLFETRQGRFFGVRRFDRKAGGRRWHLHSAAGLLHADYRTAGNEYEVLFRLTEALTRDYAQKTELFRRACLNVLACNRDDHLKNFAFLMDEKGVWRLAPLYDFTFHTGPNGWQTLSVAGEGENPRKEHLVKLAEQVDLRPRDAREIIDQTRHAVAGFNKLARAAGVSKTTLARVNARLK
jgi:serine/threonine-protein kinase HipA